MSTWVQALRFPLPMASSQAFTGTQGAYQIADPLAVPAWDEQVQAIPGASFFHGSNWARVLVGTYGHRPAYLCARRQGRIEALLPLMEVSSPLTGRRGVCLPFTDCCAPIGLATAAPAPDLVAAAFAHGRQAGWKHVEIRGSHPAFAEVTPSVTHYGHSLDLTAGPDALMAGFESSVRRGIRKAESSGVEVQVTSSSSAAMQTYYRLHCLTRKRHGLPPQPFRFFQNLFDSAIARGSGFVAVATYHGQPAAAAIFLHLGRTLIYKFGASDPAFQSARPNNVLFARIIRRASEDGFHGLHFGRTSMSNDGLRRFKLGFGAAEEILPSYRYDLQHERFVATPDRAQGRLNPLFRVLPPPVLRWLGQTLYPHLS